MVPPNSALIMPPLIVMAEKVTPPMNFITATVITTIVIVVIAVALKIPYVKSLTNPSSLIHS